MTIYSVELFTEMCDRHAEGETISGICRSSDRYPSQRQFYTWMHADEINEAIFRDARAAFEMTLLDECLDIANTPEEGEHIVDFGHGRVEVRRADMLEHRKLKVSTRFKMLATVNPKKYGAKVDLNHGGQPDNPLSLLLQQVNGTAIHPVSDDEPAGDD